MIGLLYPEVNSSSGEPPIKKKYVVELTKAEREHLGKLISSGTKPARMLNRARILLKADIDGHAKGSALIDREIARMLDTSTATVQRVRERFCAQGLEATLERLVPIECTSARWTGAPKLTSSPWHARSRRKGGSAGACVFWRARP